MSEYLLEKLQSYGASDAYPLHMPGHKRQMHFFDRPYEIDITEIDGFDNLHHAQGVLLEAQKRAAQLYGAQETFYLVNGSTCGILAAISASLPRGGRILMSRSSHKAAYHGVLLNGLRASYLYPETESVRAIYGAVRPEAVKKALADQPDIGAVLITSPTYDGVVSDIRSIAEVVHEAGAVLIVDEAHGAHFALHPYFPASALSGGADLVINSLHKTLPSLTQTALLHVQGERADREKLRKYLGIYQTSSPSYVLMAGMDACVRLLQEQGQALFDAFTKRLEAARRELSQMQALHLVTGREAGLYAFDFDRSKILISMERAGLTGPELSGLLRGSYHLEAEMEAERYVTAIMTVADTQEGFDRLVRALKQIDAQLAAAKDSRPESAAPPEQFLPYNREVMTMAQAEDCPHEAVALQDAAGRVSAEFAYLYPPGIPLLVPGEEIPAQLPQLLAHWQEIGLSLQGLADYSGQSIQVVCD